MKRVRLDDVVEYLTEGHVECFGGYPYDYEWFGDELVIASLDDAKDRNRTRLVVYDRSELQECAREASCDLEDGVSKDLEEAIAENLPDRKV